MQEYWFPFIIARFRRDTMHLDCFQEGAYLRLILHYMDTKKRLPSSKAALMRITGMQQADYEHNASILLAFFKDDGDGYLSHKTCDAILLDQKTRAAARKERAEKAAKARWEREQKKLKEKDSKNKGPDATSIHDECLNMPHNITLQGNVMSYPNNYKNLSKDSGDEQPEDQKAKGLRERHLWEEFPKLATAEDFASSLPSAYQAVLKAHVHPEFEYAVAADFWQQYVGEYPGCEVGTPFPTKQNWYMAFEHHCKDVARKAQGLPKQRIFGGKAQAALRKKTGM